MPNANDERNGSADFIIEDLHVEVDGAEILKGVDLQVRRGEVHALMGPNGSGKSTLANTLMGHPKYRVTSGHVYFKGQDILALSPDARSRLGLFLAFQYPVEIPGVKLQQFLRLALKAHGRDLPALEFRKQMREQMKVLNMKTAFANRYLNDGLSGGEKKRSEVLQLAMLRPEMAIMDETDSGLDIDALREVATGIKRLVGPEMGALVITHYQRILNYLEPDFVHVLYDGRIVHSGGRELVQQLEAEGYDWVVQRYSGAAAKNGRGDSDGD